MLYRYVGNKQTLDGRLHRIEGQVRGVERMVEAETEEKTPELLEAVCRFTRSR